MTSTNEKHKMLNRLLSLASQALVIIWASLAALWTKPFLAAYYQKLANSHLEPAGVQWLQMGPVFVVALLLSIGSFVKKLFCRRTHADHRPVGVFPGIYSQLRLPMLHLRHEAVAFP